MMIHKNEWNNLSKVATKTWILKLVKEGSVKMNNKLTVFLVCLLLGFGSVSQAATCNSGMLETTPEKHFTVHDDGTVTHNKTGLMWKVCTEGKTWDNGSCTGSSTSSSWADALNSPSVSNANGGYASKTDWRLPNVKELASIAELKCTGPAINSIVFPSTNSNNYWSSSVDTNDTDNSKVIYFGDGGDTSINRFGTGSNFVRLVRAGG